MRAVLAIALAVAVLTAASPAYADRIDGDWCSKEGKNLRIDGPSIRTPAGIQTSGNYMRHEFMYEPPEGDPDKGQIIMMRQIHDELMQLSRVKDGVPGQTEEWRRCNVTSDLDCHRRIYSGDPWCRMGDGSPQQVRG